MQFDLDKLSGTKPKIVLACTGLLVVLLGFWFFSGDSRVVPNTIKLVCVATGEKFEFSRDDVGMIPAKNPKTGKRTLVPYEDRGGRTFLKPRYAKYVLDGMEDGDTIVDRDTLEVRKTP